MIDTKELSRIGHDLKCRVYEVDCFMFGVSSSPPLAAMMKVGKALFSAQDGTMVTEAANRLQEAADELDAARARELAHEKELEASKEATRHEYERCKELESQLADAQSLVKQHEDALEFLFADGFADHMNAHDFEMFFMEKFGATYCIYFDEQPVGTGEDDESCFTGDTPLAAIEAAKGEKK